MSSRLPPHVEIVLIWLYTLPEARLCRIQWETMLVSYDLSVIGERDQFIDSGVFLKLVKREYISPVDGYDYQRWQLNERGLAYLNACHLI